jgi:hypothetical protein
MSNGKNSTARKYEGKQQQTEIIPWPEVGDYRKEKEDQESRISLDRKYLYYKGRRIPILQFQKSGYDKLLQLLVKEIGG